MGVVLVHAGVRGNDLEPGELWSPRNQAGPVTLARNFSGHPVDPESLSWKALLSAVYMVGGKYRLLELACPFLREPAESVS